MQFESLPVVCIKLNLFFSLRSEIALFNVRAHQKFFCDPWKFKWGGWRTSYHIAALGTRCNQVNTASRSGSVFQQGFWWIKEAAQMQIPTSLPLCAYFRPFGLVKNKLQREGPSAHPEAGCFQTGFALQPRTLHRDQLSSIATCWL